MAGFAIYKTRCPHCGAENSAFTSVAQVSADMEKGENSNLWNVFFACNGCNGGVVVKVASNWEAGPHGLSRNIVVPGEIYSERGDIGTFVEVTSYPHPPSHAAPDHVPGGIAAAYIEASENLYRKKFETSQMLSRKALDLATKRLLPGSRKSLYHRIEELKDAGKITAEMGEWAHIVRDEGNGSVHDEAEVTREDAAELLAFTETFLMYAFTLPGMIERRRQDAVPALDAGQTTQ